MKEIEQMTHLSILEIAQNRKAYIDIIKYEKTHYDVYNILFLTLAILIPFPLYYNSSDLVQGKDDGYSYFKFLNVIGFSGSYWILFVLTFVLLFILAVGAIYRAQSKILKKKEIGFGLTESDILADFSSMINISIYSFIGGIGSTMIGITNYWIYSEMLEKHGKTQIEAQVTTIALVVFGSITSSFEYYIRSAIRLDYILGFIITSILTLTIGIILKAKVKPLMKRPSIITYIAFGLVIILVLILLITRVIRLTELDYRNYYFDRDT